MVVTVSKRASEGGGRGEACQECILEASMLLQVMLMATQGKLDERLSLNGRQEGRNTQVRHAHAHPHPHPHAHPLHRHGHGQEVEEASVRCGNDDRQNKHDATKEGRGSHSGTCRRRKAHMQQRGKRPA